jgi:HK97 family phage major capsid protein
LEEFAMKEKLQAKLRALQDEWKGIKAKAENENRDSLTGEETKRGEEILAEIRDIKKQIKLLDDTEEEERALAEPQNQPVEETVEPDGNQRSSNVQVGQNREERKPFPNFGEFLQAVTRAADPFAPVVDPRLLARRVDAEGRAILGASESVPSDGGFLVIPEYSREIWSKVYETGQVIARCNRVPTTSDRLIFNTNDETSRAAGSRWGGVRGYWAAEGDSVTATNPKFAQLELVPKKVFALYYSTDEVVRDAVTLGTVAQQWFIDELRFKIEEAIIRGTGAGQPLGVLNAPCVVSVTAETGQDATTFVFENVVKMWARLFARSGPTSVWLINQDVWPQLLTMSLAVGTGGAPVYMPPNQAAGQPFSTLMGRPVLPIEHCSTLGTVGDVVLADLSQYLLVERDAVTADSSIHVQFITDQVTYRFKARVDGQPWWTSTLTPAQGSNTHCNPGRWACRSSSRRSGYQRRSKQRCVLYEKVRPC